MEPSSEAAFFSIQFMFMETKEDLGCFEFRVDNMLAEYGPWHMPSFTKIIEAQPNGDDSKSASSQGNEGIALNERPSGIE